MKILDRLRRQLIIWQQKHPEEPQQLPFALNNAHRVLLLTSKPQHTLLQKLRSSQAQITVLQFQREQAEENEIISPKQLNMLELVKNAAAAPAKQRWDVVINAGAADSFPLHHLAALAEAPLKFARFSPAFSPLYDVMLEGPEEDFMQQVLQLVLHPLRRAG